MGRPKKRPQQFRNFPPALFAKAGFGPYPAVIEWVEDGDTVRALVDNGRRSYDFEDLRLYGVDAPDAGKNGATAEDEARSRRRFAELLGFDLEAAERGEEARAFCLLHTAPGEDKYGRWLVRIELAEPDGRMVDAVMVDEGFARRLI